MIDFPRHGGQLHRIAARFDLAAAGLLDFSANINPDGPPEAVVSALRDALHDPTVLGEYPDLKEVGLRRAISGYAGIAPETIAVANGFVPLLDAALRALAVRRCLLPVPAFGEYRVALERAGVYTTPYVLRQEDDFRYRPDELLAALVDGGHDSILLANPQNPSGVLFTREELIGFVQAAAARQIYVLLDEAFIDYVLGGSMVHLVELCRNLIVFRSVTKFHGIPGLRVAYAVAHASVRADISANLPPWAITKLAAIGVGAALADTAFAAATLTHNLRRRNDLAASLQALGLYAYPAAANFFLVRFETPEGAERIWEGLIRQHKIVARHCASFEGLQPGHLRFAVRDDVQNALIVGALTELRERG